MAHPPGHVLRASSIIAKEPASTANPNIVHQAYLGTAEKVADLVKEPHRSRAAVRHVDR
jgi:hypothetical protein